MDRMGRVGELLLLDVLFLGGHGMGWCFWRMVGSFLLVVLYYIYCYLNNLGCGRLRWCSRYHVSTIR